MNYNDIKTYTTLDLIKDIEIQRVNYIEENGKIIQFRNKDEYKIRLIYCPINFDLHSTDDVEAQFESMDILRKIDNYLKQYFVIVDEKIKVLPNIQKEGYVLQIYSELEPKRICDNYEL